MIYSVNMPNPQVGDLIINHYVICLYDVGGSSLYDYYVCAFSGPRAPDEPRVDGGENGIKISLTATTNQFGPIRYLHLASCATTMHNT